MQFRVMASEVLDPLHHDISEVVAILRQHVTLAPSSMTQSDAPGTKSRMRNGDASARSNGRGPSAVSQSADRSRKVPRVIPGVNSGLTGLGDVSTFQASSDVVLILPGLPDGDGVNMQPAANQKDIWSARHNDENRSSVRQSEKPRSTAAGVAVGCVEAPVASAAAEAGMKDLIGRATIGSAAEEISRPSLAAVPRSSERGLWASDGSARKVNGHGKGRRGSDHKKSSGIARAASDNQDALSEIRVHSSLTTTPFSQLLRQQTSTALVWANNVNGMKPSARSSFTDCRMAASSSFRNNIDAATGILTVTRPIRPLTRAADIGSPAIFDDDARYAAAGQPQPLTESLRYAVQRR